nr:immunoglobulin heavy chain junction region [Macaca mulatta]
CVRLQDVGLKLLPVKSWFFDIW